MSKFGEYNPAEIEKKWAHKWVREKIYRAQDFSDKPKKYILIEFPYPSGERLHVGHARSYSCLDAVARLHRMKGYNVMYPMGWDAFGLPAENYAIKTGIHPSITTAQNIANAKEQAISWGLSFDWDREVNTTDPAYYKWTQWIFVQLFKKGLAYKAEIPVNWCPKDRINLANEEVIDGKCERCGTKTERRMQSQWLLKITAYADRLVKDLDTVEYREDIKQQQINWIGKKVGRKIRFGEIEVFTTKPETIMGATFVVVAPEHSFAVEAGEQEVGVRNYLDEVKNRGERERKKGEEKDGVDTGRQVVHPVTGEMLPVWVADYVMMESGTGAIMGVPAGDERDLEFAKKFGLRIGEYELYEGEIGEEAVTYHLRDWVFSRQHYWGEPIPMVNCPKCGWQTVPEEQLPVELPQVEKYQPTDTGESPLAHMDEWVNTSCPNCGGEARRETDTMPNWAGSSWYFLRYIDPDNSNRLADEAKLKYWLPVDWYNGGMEHTTLHLLYSRFWHKFLFDLGKVSTPEPYAKRTSHGVILGPDGKRMSKSRGNVINPDEVVAKFGADTLRMYEMFIGPFDQTVAWSWEGVEGVHRFLRRVWNIAHENASEIDAEKNMISSKEALALFYRTVQRVENDLEKTKFNTAVAAVMEWVTWWGENKDGVGTEIREAFVKLMAPMAPFIAEELWQSLRVGKGDAEFESVHYQQWPKSADKFEAILGVTVIVQVNGKVRGRISTRVNTSKDREQILSEALKLENVASHIGSKKYRVVWVPGRLVNLVVDE